MSPTLPGSGESASPPPVLSCRVTRAGRMTSVPEGSRGAVARDTSSTGSGWASSGEEGGVRRVSHDNCRADCDNRGHSALSLHTFQSVRKPFITTPEPDIVSFSKSILSLEFLTLQSINQAGREWLFLLFIILSSQSPPVSPINKWKERKIDECRVVSVECGLLECGDQLIDHWKFDRKTINMKHYT